VNPLTSRARRRQRAELELILAVGLEAGLLEIRGQRNGRDVYYATPYLLSLDDDQRELAEMAAFRRMFPEAT
jgi:hypothetical protein